MKLFNSVSGEKTAVLTAHFFAAALVFAGFGWTDGNAWAGKSKEGTRFIKASDYTSAKDWKVKAENLVTTGTHPLYGPLKPGFRFVMERPDHPDGSYRKEVMVLDKTEAFDVPGIGKFEARVVQEEEFYDGKYSTQALSWLAIDKTNNNVYVFGKVSWEIDADQKKVFHAMWRAGAPDGKKVAGPGLRMPGGSFKSGYRYLFSGGGTDTFGGAQNMQAGLAITTPAGKFENCVRVREQGLIDIKDVADKVWCPDVGVVADTLEGQLIASDALPNTDISSFGKYHREQGPAAKPAPAKISQEEATQIALKTVPGVAKDVVIERKMGKMVYVVEIVAKKDGNEIDVFVDIETGKVVGTD